MRKLTEADLAYIQDRLLETVKFYADDFNWEEGVICDDDIHTEVIAIQQEDGSFLDTPETRGGKMARELLIELERFVFPEMYQPKLKIITNTTQSPDPSRDLTD